VKRAALGAGFAFWAAWLIGVGLTSCATVDKTNNVSTDNYRAALSKTRDNVAACVSAMLLIKSGAQRSPQWWDVQLGVMTDTETLCDDTLKGSNHAKVTK
jgi:hypothetical protein